MIKFLVLPGFLWGALLLTSCSQAPVEDPHHHEDGSLKTTIVTGRFDGFENYKNWIIYFTGPHYRSNNHRVAPDGSFQITALNVPHGYYQLHFGVNGSKWLGSMKIKIDSLRTHVGVIEKGHE